MSKADSDVGEVYLIGAGPGDPGLLTLRGAELLGRSDVVLYDGLSNRQLLDHAPAAEHICVGKHGQSRIWKQPEIIDEMIRHANAGRTVSRLKGGDPAVFARTAEEVDALLEAQIPFQIVPGITAALAAGSYAGIPITHRKMASAVALVTGHEEPGKEKSALDWDALAKFPGTLVIYMGVTTARMWTSALMDSGKPADTPAAIVRRCSLSDQQTVQCNLGEVADHLTPASKLRPPVIVILGPVTELAQTMDWIGRRPLFGKTVLVTRPQQQAESLGRLLREQGATVVYQPAIKIGPPKDQQALDQAIDQLDSFDITVFCSRNAVEYFFRRMAERKLDARSLARCKIAVVGKQTAASLEQYGIIPDIVPQEFTADALGRTLAPDVSGSKILLPRASRGGKELAQTLTSAGASVHEVIAYEHQDITDANTDVLQMLGESKIDWVTVASSATAASLHHLFGDKLGKAKLASLSPVTTAALEQLGYRVETEASSYTMQGLVASMSLSMDETTPTD